MWSHWPIPAYKPSGARGPPTVCGQASGLKTGRTGYAGPQQPQRLEHADPVL